LLELLAAGQAKDYKTVRKVHDLLLPLTRAVCHRGSHMEGTVALKHSLVARGILDHATVRSSLLPLEKGADQEIFEAMRSMGLPKVPKAYQAWNRRIFRFFYLQRLLFWVILCAWLLFATGPFNCGDEDVISGVKSLGI
jgi:hypothetical protein